MNTIILIKRYWVYFFMDRRKGIHGINILDKKVLMVETWGHYVFPGGRKCEGEFDEETLVREIREELSGTEIKLGNYYKTFSGIMPIGGWLLESKTYFFDIEGELGEPSAEITDKRYVNSQNIKELNLTEVSKKTLVSLIEEGLID